MLLAWRRRSQASAHGTLCALSSASVRAVGRSAPKSLVRVAKGQLCNGHNGHDTRPLTHRELHLRQEAPPEDKRLFLCVLSGARGARCVTRLPGYRADVRPACYRTASARTAPSSQMFDDCWCWSMTALVLSRHSLTASTDHNMYTSVTTPSTLLPMIIYSPRASGLQHASLGTEWLITACSQASCSKGTACSV